MSFVSLGTQSRLQTIVGIEFFVETTSASVVFLVFFLALHTDRVKERTVMVMSLTRTLLQGFLWP